MIHNHAEHLMEQLRAADEVLALLDQHADPHGDTLPAAFARTYAAIWTARDQALREWNDECPDQRIHRCVVAARPYHTAADGPAAGGPCEIYSLSARCAPCENRRRLRADAREKEFGAK